MRFRHYNRSTSNRPRYRSSLTFLLVLFCAFLKPQTPGGFHHINISEALKLSIPKSSSLVAALKDSALEPFVLDTSEFKAWDKQGVTELLEADEEYQRPKLINIEKGLSLSKEDYILGKVKFIDPEKHGLKISKKDINIKAEESIASENNDFDTWYEIARKSEKQRILSSISSNLSSSQFNRLSALDYKDLSTLNDSSSTQSDPVLEQIKKSIDEFGLPGQNINPAITIAAAKPPEPGSYKWSNTPSGSKARRNTTGGPTSETPNVNPAPKELSPSAAGDSTPSFLASQTPDQEVAQRSGYEAESLDLVRSVTDEIQQEKRLEGKVEFREGLAYLGPNSNIKITHIDRGGNSTQAKLDLDTAKFHIDLAAAAGMFLVEYYDSAGQLLGYFEKVINSVKEKVLAQVKPVSWGFHLELIGKLKNQLTELVIDGLVLEEIKNSVFVDESWTYYSNFLVGIKTAGSQATNQFLSAHKKRKLEAVDAQYLEQLIELLEEQGHTVDPNLGIVMGEIKEQGTPHGFTAQITDSYAVGPVYFDDFMLPDSSLEASSYSGMFIFFNVSNDLHQVRVKGKDKLVSDLASVRRNTLSKMEFDLRETKNIRLSVTDIETNTALASSFQIAGSEDVFQSTNTQEVELSYLKNKVMHSIEFWSGPDYMPVRWNFTDRRDLLFKKNLQVFKRDELAKSFDPTKALLHIQTTTPISGLSFNHELTDLGRLLVYGYNPDTGFEKMEPGKITTYTDIIVEGLEPGLNSVQFQLGSRLMSNSLVILTPGVLSLIQP